MLPNLEEIKRRRSTLGLTQNQLAKQTGLSQSLIAKLESGKLDPSYSNAKKIFLTVERLENSNSKKVKDIMSSNIISVSINDTVKIAIGKMKKYGVSQLPVFDGKNNVGSISEKTVLDRIASGENIDSLVNEKVVEIMEDPLPSIGYDLPIKAVANLLQHHQGLLVVKKGKFVGFVAKSDLLK